MKSEGFYRRPLKAPLIPFASPEGRTVFREALLEGGMEGYFPLAEQLHTQAEPAFCGLGTLVVLLNALAIDPGRLWKGPWRWYGEEMLDCCRPLDEVRAAGITMEQFACLGRCNGARVKTFRADESTLAELRYHVRAACSAVEGRHVVAAYSRSALGQTGDGHYAPLGGYHRGRDLVLVLDVARFKYPPHWVPLPMLWEAMQPEDPEARRPRGYFLVSRGEAPTTRALCCASDDTAAWRTAVRALTGPEPPPGGGPGELGSVEAAVGAFFRRLPAELPSLIEPAGEAEGTAGGEPSAPDERRRAMDALLDEVRRTEMFAVAQGALAEGAWPAESAAGRLFATHERAPELAAVMLFACPAELFGRLPEDVAARFERMRGEAESLSLLGAEVSRIRRQVEVLLDACGERPQLSASRAPAAAPSR